jgi:hypothetical protein
MPCSDGGYGREMEAKERADLRNELKRMDPLLCSACRALEKVGFDFDTNPELADWWFKHKLEDAKLAEAAAKVEFEKRVVAAAILKPFSEISDEEKALLKKYKYL